jgi:GTP-binding protein Era
MTDYIDPFKVPEGYKSGYVAIIGKPNAGKSTLLNAMLGSKLSIISPKVQTTRHRITGIHSDDKGQIIFLDTPGILQPKYKLHESMMRSVQRSVDDADVVLLLIDPSDLPSEEDMSWLKSTLRKQILLVLNKSDVNSEAAIKKAEATFVEHFKIKGTMVVSAINGENVPQILHSLLEWLPAGPPFYPPDQLSEHPERFFVAELIREQIFHLYHSEIPYSCAVNIIQFERKEDIDVIDAEIVVSRNSQKGILIGKGGTALKKLGTIARENIETFTGNKAFLKIHVKVRDNWREKDTFLRDYGYQ